MQYINKSLSSGKDLLTWAGRCIDQPWAEGQENEVVVAESGSILGNSHVKGCLRYTVGSMEIVIPRCSEICVSKAGGQGDDFGRGFLGCRPQKRQERVGGVYDADDVGSELVLCVQSQSIMLLDRMMRLTPSIKSFSSRSPSPSGLRLGVNDSKQSKCGMLTSCLGYMLVLLGHRLRY